MRSIARRPILVSFVALAIVACCQTVAAAWPSSSLGANPVLTFVQGTSAAPFSLQLPLDPAVTVGDGPDPRMSLLIPIERALPLTVVTRSLALDLGQPAVEKEFLSLTWGAVKPRGTNLFISYSVDGGAWLPAVGGSGFDIPRGTHGKIIAYGVSLTSGDPTQSPALDDITIEYARWTGRPTDPPAGGGGGTDHKPQADRKPGSGTYRYPDAAGGSAGGSPASSESGSGGGSNAGSGSGPAGGSGAGSGVSPASGAASGTAAQSAAVPSPPASLPSGPPQSVSGMPVDAGQTVSGVAFEPAGGAPAAVTGTMPAAAAGPVHLPILPVTLAAVALAAIFFVPWLIAAARLRRITGYDLERARLFGPFWPLGR